MRPRCLTGTLFVLCLLAPLAVPTPGAEDKAPAKERLRPEGIDGALILCGDTVPDAARDPFLELAGKDKARIVLLVTADAIKSDAAEKLAEAWKAGKADVAILPGDGGVRDPLRDALRQATGVWLLTDTLLIDELRGVIGGSSAGATIQGDYLCRGSPLGNTEMMCEGYERGLGFLPGVGIDQHFAQRKRFADMTEFMKAYPKLLGIGLDEATAIVVRGHAAEVMGRGEAHFYDRTMPVKEGEPDHESVKAGGRYDLKDRKVLPAEEK